MRITDDHDDPLTRSDLSVILVTHSTLHLGLDEGRPVYRGYRGAGTVQLAGMRISCRRRQLRDLQRAWGRRETASLQRWITTKLAPARSHHLLYCRPFLDFSQPLLHRISRPHPRVSPKGACRSVVVERREPLPPSPCKIKIHPMVPNHPKQRLCKASQKQA